jgi:hypothetical protein
VAFPRRVVVVVSRHSVTATGYCRSRRSPQNIDLPLFRYRPVSREPHGIMLAHSTTVIDNLSRFRVCQ